jgi:corrinoid protein of di/trimethylamine methyltransferase
MIDKDIIDEAKKMLIEQNKDRVIEITNKAIADGCNPLELMDQAFIPAINEVGELFGSGQMFFPELIGAAAAMKAASDIVNEVLASGDVSEQQEKKTVVIASVKGDVHDIGKCIVVSLMTANGFIVHDLGRDVSAEDIIEKAVGVNADVIGTSALLTTTMAEQKVLEETLKSEGLRDRFKTIVGGAPVTPRWAKKIGADAYAENAQDGVVKIREMLA